MQKVNLLQGRFQPFTLGHMKCVEAASQKGLKTVIAQIETKKADAKHPFTDDFLEGPMQALVKDNSNDIIDIIKVKNANIVAIGEEFAKHGYEIASWTCGTDRIDSYSKMSTKYHDDAGLADDFQMIEIKRGDEDISATKVRKALADDDESTFKKLTPKCTHKYYKEFRSRVLNVTEHLLIPLSSYLCECDGPAAAGGIYATPGNTMGTGNPAMPGANGEPGSGDLLKIEKPIKLKKYRSLKDHLKEKIKLYHGKK